MRLVVVSFTVMVLWSFGLQASAQMIAYDKTKITIEVAGKVPELAPGWVYINKAMCENDTEITFILMNLKTTKWLDIWRGTTNCNEQSNRQGTTPETIPCKNIKSIQNPNSAEEIKFTAHELFGTAEGSKDCKESGDQQVYLLSTDAVNSGAVASAPAANSYIKVIFTRDSDPPPVPTELDPITGETELGVEWDQGTKPSDFDTSVAYFDVAHKIPDGAVCPTTIDKSTATPSKSAGEKATISTSGIELGEQVPVAVVSRDKAQNESEVSEVVCVQRVKTTGFWDACDADCKKDFDQCSAHPWRAVGSSMSALGLAACAIVFARRRRRNV